VTGYAILVCILSLVSIGQQVGASIDVYCIVGSDGLDLNGEITSFRSSVGSGTWYYGSEFVKHCHNVIVTAFYERSNSNLEAVCDFSATSASDLKHVQWTWRHLERPEAMKGE
jgi:hypothetical protein